MKVTEKDVTMKHIIAYFTVHEVVLFKICFLSIAIKMRHGLHKVASNVLQNLCQLGGRSGIEIIEK
jgi:hypothetical protein